MSKNSKILAVEAYIAALCNRDMAAIRELYAEDATLEDPVGSTPLKGMEAITAFYEAGFNSGITARLDGPVRIADRHAVFPFIVEVNTGNGGTMRIDVIDQFTFNEAGKVVSMKAFWSEENTQFA